MRVESTAVNALCFEGKGFIDQQRGHKSVVHGTLYVSFRDGDVYSYEPVLECQYETLLHARSVGRALWRVLPPGTGTKLGSRRTGEEVKSGRSGRKRR